MEPALRVTEPLSIAASFASLGGLILRSILRVRDRDPDIRICTTRIERIRDIPGSKKVAIHPRPDGGHDITLVDADPSERRNPA